MQWDRRKVRQRDRRKASYLITPTGLGYISQFLEPLERVGGASHPSATGGAGWRNGPSRLEAVVGGAETPEHTYKRNSVVSFSQYRYVNLLILLLSH